MCDKGGGVAKQVVLPLMRKLISTPKAPKPVAPYNQAVLVDRTLYVSGVLGLDKETMELIPGGIKEEARLALISLGNILEAAGSSYENVVKVTVLMQDMNDFGTVNEIYSEFFTKNYPARCAYQVAAIPKGGAIEIEAIAITGPVDTQDASVGCTTCGPSACSCTKK